MAKPHMYNFKNKHSESPIYKLALEKIIII